MRPLIPPLRLGLRGFIFSASPRTLVPFSAQKYHSFATTVQSGVFRPFSAGPISSRIRLSPSTCTLHPSPGVSTLNRTPQNTWTQQQRSLSTSQVLLSTRPTITGKPLDQKQENVPAEIESEGFGRSEKASRAAQVNLSARLNKDGSPSSTKPGMGEIVRLLKIARPEAKWLGGRSSDAPKPGED